ncbi:hypothetical protein NM688_g8566 [Phlebia brevispora]|uniref:Uncharacterized protein n=1 Tax=Phlebia brevispora TaxID=194682 RepID=A0ACC1RQT0_9APHY|nr:hypothetical protein NM688_g8566 [Phlebia brevispora]
MLERNLLSHLRIAALLMLLASSVLLDARLPSPSDPDGQTPNSAGAIPLASIQTAAALAAIAAGIWEYRVSYQDMKNMKGFLQASRPHLYIMTAVVPTPCNIAALSLAVSYPMQDYSSDSDDDEVLTRLPWRSPSERRVCSPKGHGAGGALKIAREVSFPQPTVHLRTNGSTRPFRPSPLALYVSPATSPIVRHATPKKTRDHRAEVRETIDQLEKVAEEVRLLTARETPPRPPKCYLRSAPKPVPPPLPERPAALAPEEPGSASSSASSSPSSSPSSSSASSSSSSVSFHAPILKGQLPPSLYARPLQKHLSRDVSLTVAEPELTVVPTVPSQAAKREPSLQRNPRWSGLWDGEPDEIQWIEEYGQWSTSSDEAEPQTDELIDSSNYDSDAHSITSSVFTTLPDSSSISTSPPTSPTRARPLSVHQDHVVPHTAKYQYHPPAPGRQGRHHKDDASRRARDVSF